MPRAKKLDVSRLSKPRLLQLQAEINKALAADREKERLALRKRLTAMAAAAGFRLEVLTLGNATKPTVGRRARRGPAPIKYRDPENPENVWSGRGMKARWLAEKVKRGARIEQYLVS